MIIRRAGAGDLKEVKELLDQVDMVHHIIRPDLFNIGRKYNDEQLLEIFKDDMRPVFVAVDENDKTMGYVFCIFRHHPNDNVLTDIKTLYIDDICVDEAARGQGVGHTLYSFIKGFAKQQGCYNITLNVWCCNPNAMKFYENMGLVPQKICMEQILDDTI